MITKCVYLQDIKKIILGAGKLTWMMIGLHEKFNFTRNSASQSIFVKSVKQY